MSAIGSVGPSAGLLGLSPAVQNAAAGAQVQAAVLGKATAIEKSVLSLLLQTLSTSNQTGQTINRLA